MEWLNGVGIVFLVGLLVPNALFARKHPEGFENKFQNKALEALEQVGRFGCFLLMCVKLPVVRLGYWFAGGEAVYIALGVALLLAYCLCWAIFWKESSVRRALWLSILPCCLFLESGIVTLDLPLIALSVLFAICHISISYRNAVA